MKVTVNLGNGITINIVDLVIHINMSTVSFNYLSGSSSHVGGSHRVKHYMYFNVTTTLII